MTHRRSTAVRSTRLVARALQHPLRCATMRSALTLAVLLSSAAPLAAQSLDPRCGPEGSGGLPGGTACQTAVDVFRHISPQLGMVTTGGNATLGQVGTLGGLGHFALVLRATGTQSFGTPDLAGSDVSAPGVERNSYPITQSVAGLPGADLAVGLYRGARWHGRRIGGVDALASAFYTPEDVGGIDIGDASTVEFADAGLKVGYGVRVGLLEESRRLPRVSVSYLQRSLPGVNFSTVSRQDAGTVDEDGNEIPGGGDTLSLRGLSTRTAAWRVVVGKKLSILGLSAGVGQDRYRSRADAGYVTSGADGLSRATGSLPVSQTLTRTNMFADLSVNLFLFTLVGEVGRVSGGGPATYNQFSTAPGKPQNYVSIGIRQGR